tara:strand:+ start:362 stop:1480 length:1119 start_codon:yes stop_codon:yes gene_type:complete
MAIAPRLIRSPATQQFLLGQSLSQQAANQAGQPVYATSQGLARVAQALGGALLQNRAQQKFKEEQAAQGDLNAKTLTSLGVDPTTAALLADPNANPAFTSAAVAQAIKPKSTVQTFAAGARLPDGNEVPPNYMAVVTREGGRTTGIDYKEIKPEKPVVVAKGATAINPDGTILFKNNAGQDEAINLEQLGIKVPNQFVGIFNKLAQTGDAKDVISELRAVLNNQYTIANTLRDDFESQNKTYFQYESSLDKILSARDDGPGDLSLIFAYMKMLDPGSVVREGEFANAENAGGVSERVRTIYNKVSAGERLSPQQRARFRNQALDIFKPERKKYIAARDRFLTLAQNAELDPNLVLRPDVDPERFDVPELVDY